MRVQERLKYLTPICLLMLIIFAALTLSACATQPASPPPVATGEGRVSYDLEGFPPNIPHVLEGRTECLACHRDGEVGQAPKTPHPEHNYCRQCHALEQ